MTRASYPDLDGALVVVTGGGRGIGLATARRLLDQGSRVVVLDLAMTEPDVGLEFAQLDVTIASMSGSIGNYPQKQVSYNASKAGVVSRSARSTAGTQSRRGSAP